MNPRLLIYTLHILHLHPSGFDNLIFILNSARLPASFIFVELAPRPLALDTLKFLNRSM